MRLKKAQDRVKQFGAERGWEKYHTLKSVIISLASEAGELLSLVEWMSDEQVEEALTHADYRKSVEDELSDVLHHVLTISNHLSIDPLDVFERKFATSRERFPVHKSKDFDPVAWKLKKIREKKAVHL